MHPIHTYVNQVKAHCAELLVCLVQLLDALVGIPVDAVEAELLQTDSAVT